MQMDEEAQELFERSDQLLALSKAINLKADRAYERLLRVQSRCTPSTEALRTTVVLNERLRKVLRSPR